MGEGGWGCLGSVGLTEGSEGSEGSEGGLGEKEAEKGFAAEALRAWRVGLVAFRDMMWSSAKCRCSGRRRGSGVDAGA